PHGPRPDRTAAGSARGDLRVVPGQQRDRRRPGRRRPIAESTAAPPGPLPTDAPPRTDETIRGVDITDKKPTSKKSPAKAADKAPSKAKSAKAVSGSGKSAPRKSVAKDPAFDGPLGQALAAVRTPVYAYVGVNDLAVEAVTGLVSDLRRRAEEAVTEAQSKVSERVSDVQNRVNEVPERVQSFPNEVEELVGRFRPDELRKVAAAYVEVAAGIYGGLAARGEDVVTRLREENPQLEAGLARVNEQVSRAADVVDDRVEVGEETLGTVARQTRSIGVKAAGRVSKGARQAAEATGDAADKAADRVDDAAYAVSDEVQSGAGKVEARTAPAKKAPAKKAPAKKTPAKKTASKSTASKPAAKSSTATKSTSTTGSSTSGKSASASKPTSTSSSSTSSSTSG